MTIQAFIEKAIEGGWSKYTWTAQLYRPFAKNEMEIPLDCIFLDPEAWKAVGKVEGWKESVALDISDPMDGLPAWRLNMHRMIDAIAEGKTIEEYLATL